MKQLVLFVLATFIVAGTSAQPLVKYVTQNGAGLKNGSSWANAWNDSIFAANLHLQPAGTEVWVAKGTYRPNIGSPVTLVPATYTFTIPENTKLYGGFAGTEDSLSARVQSLIHTVNKTTLSGLLNTPNPLWSGTEFVVNMTNRNLLDGFTISDASGAGIKVNAFYASNTLANNINNCIIQKNGIGAGDRAVGGITVSAPSNTVREFGVSNSFIIDNRGVSSGGITCNYVKINLVNCVFNKNVGVMINFYGPSSAILFNYSSGSISNCTFVGNNTNALSALFAGGNGNDSIYINNSILWGNYDILGGSQALPIPFHLNVGNGNTNRFSVKNSLYEPIVVSTPGAPAVAAPAVLLNSFSSNPLMVNQSNPAGADNQWGTADDGLQLTPCSPVANMGNNTFVNGVAKDILGRNRVFGSQVDLGAYELQQGTAQNITIYLQPANTTVNFEEVAQFFVIATGGSMGYQWQRFVYNSGWINLVNDSIYSGVTTSNLLVKTLSGPTSGTKFRCLLNNQFCSGLQSQEATLTIRPQTIVTLCPGDTSTLTSFPPPLPFPTMTQWYVDTDGTGYHLVVNGPHYSGASTPTLQLINIPSAWYGHKYVYIFNGGSNSPIYNLKFANTWRGTANNSWENPANWSCGLVPDANTDVTIGTTTIAGSIYPSNITVGANSICRSLTVLPGGNTVTVLPGFTLTVVH